jgi:hypothetical protein
MLRIYVSKNSFQNQIVAVVFIFTLSLILSCIQKKSVTPKKFVSAKKSSIEDSESYYSCLLVNTTKIDTDKEETPGICLNTKDGIQSQPTSIFFSDGTVLSGKTRKVIDIGLTKTRINTIEDASISSSSFISKAQATISPLKVDDGVPSTFTPQAKKFRNSINAFITYHQNPNKGKKTSEIQKLADKEPYKQGDITKLEKIVMDADGAYFKTHTKFLYDQINLYANKPTIRKQLEMQLVNLGKIRKEVEYSTENQVQILKLWKQEVMAKINTEPDTIQQSVNKNFDQAIAQKSTKKLFDLMAQSKSSDGIVNIVRQLKTRKFVAISRPVEDIGYQRIASGYDGKPVNMKGKSSTVTGFIPLNQLASKLPARYLKDLENTDSKPSAYLSELIKYQHKSELGLVTIEPNFLPTSVAKPLIKEIRLSDGSARYELADVKKIDLPKLSETDFRSELQALPKGGFEYKDAVDLFPDLDKGRLSKE